MTASNTTPTNRDPPGVPPFPPPDLNFSDDEDNDKVKPMHKSKTIRFADDNKVEGEKRDDHDSSNNKDSDKNKDLTKVKPTSLQQKMLAMAGQDIDQFMKEMEVVHKRRESERAQDLNARLSLLDGDPISSKKDNQNETSNTETHQSSNQAPPQQPPMPLMGLPPPPPLMYRPPPPPLHLRIPPPPPPRIGIRLPPGPPPGMPRMMGPRPPMPMPRVLGPNMSMPGMPPPPPVPSNLSAMSNSQKTPNVLSAAPQLISTRKDKDASGKSSTTIEAKPQIRNLAADVTRFLPTSLRVKRIDDKKKLSATPSILPVRMPERIPPIPAAVSAATIASAAVVAAAETQNTAKPPQQVKTKDDAYMQFMQEMQGCIEYHCLFLKIVNLITYT